MNEVKVVLAAGFDQSGLWAVALGSRPCGEVTSTGHAGIFMWSHATVSWARIWHFRQVDVD